MLALMKMQGAQVSRTSVAHLIRLVSAFEEAGHTIGNAAT